MAKILLREIGPYQHLYRDAATGIAWVEDGSTGMGNSCHPNIDATGSVSGMRARGYWGRDDETVRTHGFIYNTSRLVITSDLDQIAADACQCRQCLLRREAARSV